MQCSWQLSIQRLQSSGRGHASKAHATRAAHGSIPSVQHLIVNAVRSRNRMNWDNVAFNTTSNSQNRAHTFGVVGDGDHRHGTIVLGDWDHISKFRTVLEGNVFLMYEKRREEFASTNFATVAIVHTTASIMRLPIRQLSVIRGFLALNL